MKRFLLFITILTVMVSCTAQPDNSKNEAVIEKSTITVVDGKFTPEIMHLLGKVSDPQVSPDGTKILYGVTYTDIEMNKGMRQLFVINIDGTDNRQITHFPKSSNNARWIDNSTVAFLKGGQIYVKNIEKEKAVCVSDFKDGISAFEFAPDCAQIMYISEIQSAIKPTDKYPDLDKSTGRTIEGLMYRHWDCFVETIPHTWFAPFNKAALASGNSIAVGEGKDIIAGTQFELPTLPFGGLEQLSWSPDGKKIAYSCRKLTGKEYAFSTNTDIYLYDTQTAACENLSEGMPGYDTDPVYSPDGKYIAWISMERGGFEADKQRLMIIDLETRVRRELSFDYKYNITSPVWKKDGTGLYFNSLVNALDAVFEINLYGEYRRITAENLWYDFAGVQQVGDKLICTNHSMERPNEIVSISAINGNVEQITHENDYILSQVKSGKCEQRWITTTDKKKMHTWVMYPPDFDPAKQYPAILFCTGGPQGTLSQGWSTRWNYKLMAAQGYIVILPNRRGTTAFGQEWCDQISGDYCGQNMKDYLSAVADLKKEPFVGKVAAAGASYGGYSIYYLAGIHKNVFSAFVAHAGIFTGADVYDDRGDVVP